MTITEALKHCKCGHLVRPVIWRTTRPRHWVEFRPSGDPAKLGVLFVECGAMEEMPHRLDLQFEAELLGEWEEVQ